MYGLRRSASQASRHVGRGGADFITRTRRYPRARLPRPCDRAGTEEGYVSTSCRRRASPSYATPNRAFIHWASAWPQHGTEGAPRHQSGDDPRRRRARPRVLRGRLVLQVHDELAARRVRQLERSSRSPPARSVAPTRGIAVEVHVGTGSNWRDASRARPHDRTRPRGTVSILVRARGKSYNPRIAVPVATLWAAFPISDGSRETVGSVTLHGRRTETKASRREHRRGRAAESVFKEWMACSSQLRLHVHTVQ